MSNLDTFKRLTRKDWQQQPKGLDFELFFQQRVHPLKWDTGEQPLWGYDKNAAFLGACTGLKVGVGPYYHYLSPRLGDRAGMWQVHYTPQAIDPPAFYRPFPQGLSWQWTPIVELADQMGYQFTCTEAYLWPESVRVFDRFYEYCRELRKKDKQAAKTLYVQTFGALAAQPEKPWPGMLYRPDWRNMIAASCKARMLRQVYDVWQKEQAWPVAAWVDCLYYTCRVHSLPISDKIGGYKEAPCEIDAQGDISYQDFLEEIQARQADE